MKLEAVTVTDLNKYIKQNAAEIIESIPTVIEGCK